MVKSSKKTEKLAVNKIEDLVHRIENADCKFNVDDTGISWDGDIYLYNGNIDEKENYDISIKTQIKGRTVNIKRLPDKRKFEVDKKDLENYLKEDGTIFLVVLFKDIDDFKIYCATLLPYNLRLYLKETPNVKGKIQVKIKEVKDYRHLETILRNFAINKKEQKRISDNVFQQGEVSITKDGNKFKVYDWRNKEDNLRDLLGEEKYLYKYDELNNITSITCAEICAVTESLKINITNKNGDIFYSTVNHTVTKETNKIFFGNAFELDYENKKFNLKIQGKLSERIQQLSFLKCLFEEKGFVINDAFIPLIITVENKKQYDMQCEIYNKINNFLINHKISKNLDLDNWNDKDLNDIMTWISAIDDNKPLKIKSFEISSIGSIQINDLRFSIFADKRDDGGFDIYSIWNSFLKTKYIFTYNDGAKSINTKNWFSILNKEAYASDDVNFDEMRKIFEDYELLPDEEILLNFQALEIIKAYDYNGNEELLDYAMYLLNKIDKCENLVDIVYINKMQINKRKNFLTDDMKIKLIDIKNKNEDPFYKISVNLLIDNAVEANIIFSQLSEQEQKMFESFPIAKYLKK